MLEKINSPEDIKKLNIEEKKELSEEIRKYILEIVSENGGHLASNLGVVELTIALHSVYNFPTDKIVWDVGHQSYVHKIITGRREQLKTLRKLDGIAGFPKSKESEYDNFNTGHSSTSISAALGIARARDLKGENNDVIAVIGDGALTGGMALEALNDVGYSNTKMTVILNDNEMSISKNMGGLNMFLSKLRTKKLYKKSSISIKTWKAKKQKADDYSKVFGEKLVELAKENPNIVAVTASMKDGTGLTKFAKEFPDRFFDVGIAEQHAVTMAAGMAKEGMIPVVPIYSSFYQRAYDQVIHDVAMQDLPVVMCVDRAGVVGADGETHQGTLDMAFFRLVPHLTIMAPKDFEEFRNMLEFAVNLGKPVVIRYPRGGEEKSIKFENHPKIELGKAEIVKEGENLTIIAIGKRVAKALELAEKIEKQHENLTVEVINARFLKPLDKETIKQSILKTKKVITMEDGTEINGLGTAVEELIVEEKLQGIELEKQAWPDEFIKHGTVEQLEKIFVPEGRFLWDIFVPWGQIFIKEIVF